MTLNVVERLRTSDELDSNLALSGLTFLEVGQELYFTPERLPFAVDEHAAEANPGDTRYRLSGCAAMIRIFTH